MDHGQPSTPKIRKKRRPWTLKRISAIIRNELLIFLTVICLVGGAFIGLSLRTVRQRWTKREISYIRFPGEIGNNILKGITIPLFMSSIISSLGSMDMRLGRHILRRTLPFFISMTFVAIWIGIAFTVAIRPGNNVLDDDEDIHNATSPTLLEDSFYDLVRHFFPDNVVSAMVETVRTELRKPRDCTGECPLEEYDILLVYDKITNFRGLLVYSIIFGFGVARVGMYGRPVLGFTHSLSQAMSKMCRWAVWVLPVTTLSLVAADVVAAKDLAYDLRNFRIFWATYMGAEFFYAFGVLPAIYYWLTRENPWIFMARITPVIVSAFATKSSLSTLPILLRCLDEIGVRPRISRLVVPIGCFFGLTGSAIYCQVSGLTLAQFEEAPIDTSRIFASSFMSLWATVYVSGTNAGLESIARVAEIFSLDYSHATHYEDMDWLMDAVATCMSAINFSMTAAYASHHYQTDLNRLPPFNQVLREGLILKKLTQITGLPDAGAEDEAEKGHDSTVDAPDQLQLKRRSARSGESAQNDKEEEADPIIKNLQRRFSTFSVAAREKLANE